MENFQILNKFCLTDGGDELSFPSAQQIHNLIDYLSLYIYCHSDKNTFIVQEDDLLYFLSEMKNGLKEKCELHNVDLRGVVYQTEPVAQVDIFCNGEYGLLVIEPINDNDKLLYDYLINTKPSY